MAKEEFLKKLKKKIDILEESEVEDILKDYEGFIAEKVNQGMSEEEAVKQLGNINEIVEELLSAYKIKKPQEKNNNIINDFVDHFIDISEKVIYTFSHKSLKEILHFVFEIIGIFIILFLCKIPFELIISLGQNVVYDLCTSIGGLSLYRIVGGIGKFVIEMIYLIFAVILFIKLFENRYANSDFFEGEEEENNSSKEKNNSLNESKKEFKTVKKEKNYQRLGIIDVLVNICLIFIKCFVFFILIWVIFYIIAMTAAVGISIYLLTLGITYFGFYLGIIALLSLGICVFIVLFNFIFNRKNHLSALLITTLVSLALLGVGIGIASIEIAKTEVVYENENDNNLETKTFEYQMKDNLVLHNFGDNYQIDDTLGDTIRLEYKYNSNFADYHFYDRYSTYQDLEIIITNYDVTNFKYDNKIFNQILEDLKKKKIQLYKYDLQVTIYVSNDVYNKLQANEEKLNKLYDLEDYNYDLEDICEELNYQGYDLPSYCLPYLNEEM